MKLFKKKNGKIKNAAFIHFLNENENKSRRQRLTLFIFGFCALLLASNKFILMRITICALSMFVFVSSEKLDD